MSSSKTKHEKHRKQQYRPAWENQKEYAGWLRYASVSMLKGYCKACDEEFLCETTIMKRHAASTKHALNFRTIKTNSTINYPVYSSVLSFDK